MPDGLARRPPPGWPRALRAPTAAAYLDVSESHFRAHVWPHLRKVPLGGRAVGVLREDLDAWVDARAAQAPPSAPESNPWPE